MSGYYLLLVWFAVAWGLSKRVKSKQNNPDFNYYAAQNKKFAILSSLGVVLITGLRHFTVGPDSDSYTSYITNLHRGIWLNGYDRFEKGYSYLSQLIAKFTGSYTIYFLIIALIVMVLYAVYLYKASDSFFWIIFFYVTIGPFIFQLTGLRQAIGMALCAASLRFVKDKKIVPFIIMVFLASQFHMSALIFLPFYFVGRMRPSFRSVALFVLGTVVVLFANEWVLNTVNNLLGYDKGYENVSGGWVNFVLYGGVVILSLTSFNTMYSNDGRLEYKYLDDRRKYNIISFNMSIFALLTYMFRYWFRMAERGSKYFMIGVVVLLANYLCSIEDDRTRTFIKLGAMVLAIALFIYRQTREGGAYIYHFFWQLPGW